MEYLHIIKIIDKGYFRISIISDFASKIKSFENNFGKIDRESSLVFSCDNRILLMQIKDGLNAYLNNYYISPDIIGNGVTEFYDIKSFDKCKSFLDIYVSELNNFKKNGILNEFLDIKRDFNSELDNINSSRDFMEAHSRIIDRLHSTIVANKSNIIFKKTTGYYVLSSIDTSNLDLDDLPIFQWVKKSENEILLDIKAFNEWKKDGRFKETRKLVEIKYFNEFTLKNIEVMFK